MSIQANQLPRVTTVPATADVILIDPSTNEGSVVNAGLVGGDSVTVDTALSATSENPVQNKAIYAGIQETAEDLTEKINDSYPTGTAGPAPVAVIDDGADDIPVKSLAVGIEPVQNLNGYDKPWAGGAGKNILPLTAGTKTANGVTATINSDGSISLSGTATADGFLTIASGMTFEAGTYTLKEFTAGGKITSTGTRSQVISSTANTGISVQWSDAQGTAKSGSLASASDYIFRIRIENGKSYAGITITTMLVKGSDAPTAYEPYSNICPISGWDAVKVMRTGANLMPPANVKGTVTYSGITYEELGDGRYHIYGTSTKADYATYYLSKSFFIPKGDGNTYLLLNNSREDRKANVRFVNGSTDIDGFSCNTPYRQTNAYSVLSEKEATGLRLGVDVGTTVDMTVHPMFVPADEYENHSITLPTTVYGGTLDVTKGILTVDRGYKDLTGSESWTMASGTGYVLFSIGISEMLNTAEAICNRLETISISERPSKTGLVAYTDKTLRISFTTADASALGLNSVDSFKTWLASNPLQVVYFLATPQTYTLSPVQVKTLLGENRIYADAGDVTVEYRVDFNEAGLMYIPKAPTADGTYRLTVDVTGGTPTYRWEAAE